MSEPFSPPNEELTGAGESPRHGFRGPTLRAGQPDIPAGLTIAITRETGSRGASISKRIGSRLNWQVYTQDLLEYLAQEGSFRQELLSQLTPQATQWVDDQLQRLFREQNLSRNPAITEMARTILSLGTQGEVVLLGRGAGCILPARSTLHVRLVAPEADRIAYLGQWQRLTEEEAAVHLRNRDQQRAEFLTTHFHRQPGDVHMYDMVLNTSLLGEELCAELIVQAAQAKRETMKATHHF